MTPLLKGRTTMVFSIKLSHKSHDIWLIHSYFMSYNPYSLGMFLNILVGNSLNPLLFFRKDCWNGCSYSLNNFLSLFLWNSFRLELPFTSFFYEMDISPSGMTIHFLTLLIIFFNKGTSICKLGMGVLSGLAFKFCVLNNQFLHPNTKFVSL